MEKDEEDDEPKSKKSKKMEKDEEDDEPKKSKTHAQKQSDIGTVADEEHFKKIAAEAKAKTAEFEAQKK